MATPIRTLAIPIIVFLLVLSAVSSSSLPPETEDGIQIVFAERVEQVTYIKTPGNRIEYSTTVHPTSRAGPEVKYGAYYNQEPDTFSPISLHYENRPFLVFEKLERKVDIPLRGHIQVTDQYKMRQESAWYKRIFSFFDKDERIFSSPECPRIWPTAHELLSSNKDRLYLQLRQGPRYGWHCMFTIGYGLPEDYLSQSEDGRRYINLTFGVPDLLDTVVNDFTTVVVLPEGSKNPQHIVSFPMERDDVMARLAGLAFEMQTSYSYDDAGRAKVVLNKKILVAEHSVPFQVYYESNPIFMLTDLLILWPAAVLLLLFIAACISYLCYESNPILMLANPLTLVSSAALVYIAFCIIHFYFT